MPIAVFYSSKMVADSESFSPSAAKPGKVVESWRRQFILGKDIGFIEPFPVTVEELVRAHDPQFVRDILACKRDNGFGNKSRAVAESLPYTSGAMLSAARHALEHDIAVAPCSGFHHAEYKVAQGFCTFNGLMVTALALRAEYPKLLVGILDLDMHFGNGTADIIRITNSWWAPDGGKFQNPGGWIKHATAGMTFRNADQAPEFFSTWLPKTLDAMKDCDIVLYQAGADPHIDDPHGGWLTTAQLRQRDAVVFDTLAGHDVAVAWNLAGGYQIESDGSIPKVLEIHDNTMRECVRVYEASRTPGPGPTSSASPRTSSD